MRTPILIPAYRPGPQLPALVEELIQKGASRIVIVDNASGPDYAAIFDRCAAFPQVRILRNHRNLGKGASLKAGMRYLLESGPGGCGVVTADADGQHHPDDILETARVLAQNPECLVLGSRKFEGPVPLRSRVGNNCTRVLVRLILGQRLQDSQCGLRGIPVKLIPYLLELPSNAYEFELDVLVAAKHLGLSVIEQSIRTIYEPGNPSSHFDPIRDSMKIYFVLFRFSLLSLLTAALDNLVFYFAYHGLAIVLSAQAISRGAAMLFNYRAARKAVFLSHEPHKVLFPRYISVVLASGAASYGLIRLLGYFFSIGAIPAKIIAESLLFALNFVLLRDFVFTGRSHHGTTDWIRYRRADSWVARLSRKHTAGAVVAAFGKRQQDSAGGIVVELFTVLSVRSDMSHQVRLHHRDILVVNHLHLLRPGGYAILSFPMPTLRYRRARTLAAFSGLWNFAEARPIIRQEVLDFAAPFAGLAEENTLWPLLYTQHLVIFRKREVPNRTKPPPRPRCGTGQTRRRRVPEPTHWYQTGQYQYYQALGRVGGQC